jgi:rhodanese-related sulfurtransferase
MKRPALPLALALFAALFVFSATALAQSPAASSQPVEPGELARALAQPDAPLLLDVRTPEEFAKGHVPGARLVPLQELASRLAELDAYKQRGVIAYCEVGGRAAKAADLLRANGFANVRLLDGSMRRWREEKRPVATGS